MRNTRAFTLVELIVVMAIISILSLIGYISYSENIIDARDSQRINDLEKLQIDLKSHKQKEGAYPLPISPVDITNSGTVIYQGTMTSAIISNVLSNIPKDSRSGNWYWYSVTNNRQVFQIALTLENGDSPKAVVKGDYKSIAKNLFPTLLLAVTANTDVNASSGKFILNGGSYNLPYDMRGNLVSYTGALTLTEMMNSDSGVTVETGGSYLSCLEAYEAGRSMGSGTYQIVNDSGALVDTACSMDY
ncbi:TPA: hypothetical protein DCZ36_03630 [Candidatus Gracilibacteria bacterium]|nr:hypothetical protein [Candidatus Gracilibacteria bacterium]